MSTNESVVSIEVVPSDAHIEAAQALLQELRKMREAIPHLVINLPFNARQGLNNAASVPQQFIELTAVAIANERSLVRGDGATPAEIRNFTRYADAYSPLADELEALAQFVRHAVTAARNRAGSEALTTYALAQRLAKRPETAHLAPYVADMRRALGRVRRLTAEQRQQRQAEKAEQATAPPA